MKRLFYASVWLFFLPAILVWRGLVLFTMWLVAHLPPGPAYRPPQRPGDWR
jgi:hypothetical protein